LWRTRIDRIAEIAYARAMSFAEDTAAKQRLIGRPFKPGVSGKGGEAGGTPARKKGLGDLRAWAIPSISDRISAKGTRVSGNLSPFGHMFGPRRYFSGKFFREDPHP
jgi:hypothetical protein